jgi:hypothetical protein
MPSPTPCHHLHTLRLVGGLEIAGKLEAENMIQTWRVSRAAEEGVRSTTSCSRLVMATDSGCASGAASRWGGDAACQAASAARWRGLSRATKPGTSPGCSSTWWPSMSGAARSLMACAKDGHPDNSSGDDPLAVTEGLQHARADDSTGPGTLPDSLGMSALTFQGSDWAHEQADCKALSLLMTTIYHAPTFRRDSRPGGEISHRAGCAALEAASANNRITASPTPPCTASGTCGRLLLRMHGSPAWSSAPQVHMASKQSTT